MPTISSFYGIIIVMYLRDKEHNPPHIHAITQDFDAPFSISTGELLDGFLPPKAKKLVKEFHIQIQNRTGGNVGDRTIRQAPAIRIICFTKQ